MSIIAKTEAKEIKKMRDSQFELLRIVSMVCIIFYHLFLENTGHLHEDFPIYLGIQIPIHIGVLLFVMISGYYHIHTSLRGGVRLILIVMVYYLPLALFNDIPKGNFVGVVKDLLIVSYTRYWFFRDYLFLFLFAPVVNKYLHEITPRQRVYILSILSFMAIWVGTSRGYGPLADGKNLTNFILLYVVGDSLRAYHDLWSRISTKKLIIVFIAINTMLLVSWLYSYDSLMSKFIWAISFPYCSPLLYLNAILVFMIFGKLKLQSKVINTIALSVFSVYIIHCHPVISEQCIRPVANVILNICNNNPLTVIPLFFIFTILIFVACMLIDQAFQPLWQYAGQKSATFEEHLKQSKLK